MDNSLENWLILHFSFLSTLRLKELLHQFGDVNQLVAAGEKSLMAWGLSEVIIERIKNPDRTQIKKALQFTEKLEYHIITFDHPDYPILLKEISHPPVLLYCWGDPKLLNATTIAIVGSRNPTPSGAENAFHFARELSTRGLQICSGMAMGVDGQSHRGALEAKGKTLAILGSGLKKLYPPAHRKLAEAIAENGAVLSEFPLDTGPQALHFPIRNRLIAGSSLGTLVVEAALKSGSLITARLAMEQNREVFAIPGSIHSPQSRGCHAILKDGATLVENVEDILREIGHFTAQTVDLFQAESVKDRHPDGDCQRLLDAIGFDQASVDQLVSRLGLGAKDVSARLLNLELQGYIKPIMGGYVRVTGAPA